MRGRGRVAEVEGVLGMLGTRLSRTCTPGSCVDVAATRSASRMLSTALGHSRSHKNVHGLDLVLESAEQQEEKEKKERGVEEHVVSSTGPAPSTCSPGLHEARPGLGFLGCSSGC